MDYLIAMHGASGGARGVPAPYRCWPSGAPGAPLSILDIDV
jgi:hypothetical protein